MEKREITKMGKIAFVPIRKGSKSIPNKNTRLFCSKPLLFWVLDTLTSMNLFDQVWIATDCPVSEELVKNRYRDVRLFRRSPDNATDHSPTIDVVMEFLQSRNFPEETIFLLAQATSPFTNAGEFGEAVKLIEHGAYDSALSCVRMKKFLWSESGEPLNYDLKKNVRRQDFNGFLSASGSFYVNTVSRIMENRQLISGKVGVVEVAPANQVELDEPIDWVVGEAIMKYLKERQTDVCKL